MKTAKEAQREARDLFHHCIVDGALDEERTRLAARRLATDRRRGSLSVLSRFARLVRLERNRRVAAVRSATPLAPEVRRDIEASLARVYGPGVITSFAEDPALVGGVRIAIGSDVYDGTIAGRLRALDRRFSAGLLR
jgi:F-type H+-transporting ATPase subunit delta